MHDSNSAKSKLSFQGRKNKKTINCRHNDISRKNTITNRIKISKRMHESYIHNTHTTTKLDARLKKKQEPANHFRMGVDGNDFVEQFFFYIGSVTKASDCDTERGI